MKTSSAVLLSMLLVANGCSSVANPSINSSTNQEDTWMTDGLIAISRPVPSVSEVSPETMLGFMPLSTAAHIGTWLSVDRSKGSVSLMDGDHQVSTSTGDGIPSLKPGQYQVLHKQRNALWYAPDQYFQARNLKIPPQGDRSRFLRGALGDFAVFINKDTPLYSGPLWTEEIGGVRLSEDEMSKLYYQINVGSVIEIK